MNNMTHKHVTIVFSICLTILGIFQMITDCEMHRYDKNAQVKELSKPIGAP